MSSRREFLKDLGGATAGIFFVGCGLGDLAFGSPQSGSTGGRREIVIGGRRVRTVDMHAHCYVHDVWPLVRDNREGARNPREQPRPADRLKDMANVEERLRIMDQKGVDVQAVSLGTGDLHYWAERDLAREIMRIQNEKIAELCAQHPDRFVGLAGVSLPHPDLAVEQLEDAVRRLGMRGCLIAGSVNGEELSASKFHPFWAKAEELGCLVFMHPAGFREGQSRLRGTGDLRFVIGNPFETTVALSHLILEGTLDRYPGLNICFSHGGGFLPSYIGRSDRWFANQESKPVQKRPSEYLKRLYFDSMVYTNEQLRHLIAEVGASQIVVGTDYPFELGNPDGVDHVLGMPGLSDADRTAILGGNAANLLRIGL